MPAAAFETRSDGVVLAGWTRGSGVPVLLLHGGPGLDYDYLDGLAQELGDGFLVAGYQQRGLSPSSEAGPFAVADHVADVARVLDELGWERAVILGHSWGGHLALHVAAAVPDRVTAVLAVDPLGGVGDGGSAEFEAELFRRTPADVSRLAQEADERALAGEGSASDSIEGLRLLWPAYFAIWEDAPPFPPMRISVACYAETYASMQAELPRLEASLSSIRVPVGFVAGELSPMPVSASADTAARIPGAWVVTVPGAGHFPWMAEAPGCVRAALQRLSQ